MKRLMIGSLVVALGCVFAAGAGAQEAAAGVAAMKAELAELQARVERLQHERDARREMIRESPDLTALRETLQTAEEAYRQARTAYDAKLGELTAADINLATIISDRETAVARIETLEERIEAATSETIMPAGSVWKYFAKGTDPGADWRDPAFDDSAWPRGKARLGYGDAGDVTTVDSGSEGNPNLTVYFRADFTVDDPARYEAIVVKLLRDDGAVVYLNGTEVARDNMPAGPVSHETLAQGTVSGGSEDRFFEHDIGKAVVVKGSNVLAVEVHQAGASSSDISFDLAVVGRLEPTNWKE